MKIKNKKYFFMISIFGILIMYHPSSFGESYYYCHHGKEQEISAFDRIIIISKTPSGRLLETNWDYEQALFNTYDEQDRILTTYQAYVGERYNRPGIKRRSITYYIYELDLKNNLFILSNAVFLSSKEFPRSYGIPYTEENVKKLSRDPDLLEYVPKHPDQVAIAYRSNVYHCKTMGFLEYKIESVKLFLLQIISV